MILMNDATRAQVTSADPNRSTWLSANAGSGKTRVLTDRVARLLLEGVSPQNILCLTYTKAAASEMQNRLFQRLGAWAMKDNDVLTKELQALGAGTRFSDETLSRARTLFAKAIDTPGGLKIQTIHSFCASVLRRFPLEAGVSPDFAEIEDRDGLRHQQEVLDAMCEGPERSVVRAVLHHLHDQNLNKFVAEILRHRDIFLYARAEAVRGWYGLGEGTTVDTVASAAFTGEEPAILQNLQVCVRGQAKTYQKFTDKLATAMAHPTQREQMQALFPVFLQPDGKTSRSENFPQSNHSKAGPALKPVLPDLHAWMDRVAAAKDSLLAMAAAEKTIAAVAFAQVFIPAYDARKAALGLLDFDDLIRKTRALLTDRAVAQWVLYKLDGGVDHILVDEAQDTSPEQWDVIRALAAEFASGAGARQDDDRSIFVVGDKKQSIYSFQGADPSGFDRMRDHFNAALEDTGAALQKSRLEYSFRSAPAVLDLVDRVFAAPNDAGLERDIRHLAFNSALPGRVDLWPAILPGDDPDPTDWTTPVDQRSPENHLTQLAEKIADTVSKMIGTPLPHREKDGVVTCRPMTAGDVMILVQRRDFLFSELIRACKARNIDIAGADVVSLSSELAVKDLISLLRFVALPSDDLALAEALRSPLFGWSEQALFTLAHGRQKGERLWQRFQMRQEDHRHCFDTVSDLMRRSDFLRPYDLLERILIHHNGRQRLLARLGPEAEDSIDALLGRALSYEQSNIPSLTGFLAWLEDYDVKVKRQVTNSADRLRVMTVHGSKGLEAPVVILPDTAARKREIKDEFVASADRVMWRTKKAEAPNVAEEAAKDLLTKQDEERRRLLYVAMTRAEKWLIVAAAGKETGNNSWYHAVAEAMNRSAFTEIDTDFGPGRRFETGQWGNMVASEEAGDQSQPPESVVLAPVPELPTIQTVLNPSDLGGAKAIASGSGGDETDAAMARGRFLHALFENLPLVPESARKTCAARLLSAVEDHDLVEDPSTLIGQAIGVLENPTFSDLFAPDALREVPFTASMPEPDGRRISGIFDVLIVDREKVRVVDYKSNKIVPSGPSDTPEGVLRQMGAYCVALEQIFPDHQIVPQILWIETATLQTLDRDHAVEALFRSPTS